MPDLPHESGPTFWHADADECKHGDEPNIETDGAAWDIWSDRHPIGISDIGRICLDASAGYACLDCSAEEGDMVPWPACRVRDHRRPARGMAPNPDAKHQQVTVWVGTFECLERECDEYFTDGGDEIPDKERCSHIRDELACSCQRGADGDYDGTCPLAEPAIA